MRLRRFKPNPAHLRVATLAILIVMCTLLILSAVFPFPEGTWGFLSIGTSYQTSANPDWLSGNDYRKEITIDGSTAGAQSNYSMWLDVYKDFAPIYDTGMARPIYGNVYPHAYYYNGVTYVSIQGQDCDPYVDAYNHSTGTWHGAVKVGTNPLTSDFHGAPAIIVDNSGYIHVFYGCHTTDGDAAVKHSKSTSTEDISAWSAQADIAFTDGATYPMAVKDSDGYLWLFARNEVTASNSQPMAYRKSEDHGATWEALKNIVGADANDGIYFGSPDYDSTNNRIHIAWTYNNVADNENLYHAYLCTKTNGETEGRMYDMGGTERGNPTISTSDADDYCKIVSYTSETEDYQIGSSNTLKLDSNGYPHIIYSEEHTQADVDVYYKFWNGSAWNADAGALVQDASTTATTHYAMFITATDDIDAYVPISGAVRKYNWNGSTWGSGTEIASAAQIGGDGTFVCQDVLNGLAAFKVVFSGYDTDDFSNNDLRVFALSGTDDFLDYSAPNPEPKLPAISRVGCGGNCEDDFDDIRFTQTDGSTLVSGFWREFYISTDYAIFAVEFPTIADGGGSPTFTNYYLYYGNNATSYPTEADTTAQGAATFQLFEDAEWGIDTDELDDNGGEMTWTVAQGTTQISTVQDIGDVTGHYGTRSIRLPEATSPNNSDALCDLTGENGHALQFRIYKENAAWFRFYYGDGTYQLAFAVHTDESLDYHDGDVWIETGETITPDAWHLIELLNIDFDTNRTYDIAVDGELVFEDAVIRTNANTPDQIRLLASTTANADTWIDNFIVRAWCNPEPTWGAWGAEEGQNIEISNSPSGKDFGTLEVNTTANTAIDYFTITNIGNTNVDVVIYATNATGGDDTWVLANNGTPGENIFGLVAGLDDDDDTFDTVVKQYGSTPYNELVADLAEDATQDWGLKIYMPTTVSGYDAQQMSATITLVASES